MDKFLCCLPYHSNDSYSELFFSYFKNLLMQLEICTSCVRTILLFVHNSVAQWWSLRTSNQKVLGLTPDRSTWIFSEYACVTY